MKKAIIPVLISIVAVTIAIAASGQKQKSFAPLSWNSKNSKDVINIHGGSGFGTYYLVQIYVNNMEGNPGSHPAGVNVKNCGSISHINPGSTALCMLTYTNPTVSFNSDSEENAAYGLFQISDR